MHKHIKVRGAREHNLKGVNIDLPRDKLIVITGLSGSGKSSLAFDTIYAEGQRRYVESLSAYARQFLELQGKPDVDSIEGLSPAISIEQKTTSKNPRSTVGTVTEIYDYMRLLWARVGVPYSPATGLPITSQTVSMMVDRVMELPKDTKLYILAPIVRGRKGEYRKELAQLMKDGFQRAKIDGEFYRIEDAPDLEKKFKHDIDVVVDRVVVREGLQARLAESIETALRLADGLAVAEKADDSAERMLFSEKFACPVSGFTISEIEPRLFSFNSPHGACPVCDGLGKELKFDPGLVVPDETKSIAGGAIAAWPNKTSGLYMQTIKALSEHYGFKVDKPFKALADGAKDVVLYGTKGAKIKFVYQDDGRRYETTKPFEGVIPNLERRYRETESTWMRDELGKYMSNAQCETCHGKRLKPEALSVRVGDMDISVTGEMSIKDALARFIKLGEELSAKDMEIATRILKEIRDRLKFLNAVGLDYLTLGRGSGSLSGGESQRIRLASQIGSGLTGVLYVLDEPSIGLHQRDNERLLETLQNLRDLGNTVLVVEHDEDAILTADYVVDMGPLAGVNGGQVVAEGTPDKIKKSKKSLTAKYLTGKKEIAIPAERRKASTKKITVKGARGNNLKNVTAEFPIGLMTCVSGVSGGGKSTLTIETLYKATARRLNKSSIQPMPHDDVTGLEHLDKVIDIDQSPIGRTPRSNPATYTGAFTPIRDWFSGLPEAKLRGYKPGRFSFNVKGGRCEACQGGGVIKIEMHFLPDVYVTCDVCKGARYNRETLEIKFKGKSIADVLDMTIDEAADFFKAVPSIRDKMVTLQRVGLTYLKVGQQATTLSGGEAQRVKLAKELAKRATGRTLYILDEPTTGLHFEDVNKLLTVLNELVESGNTMVIIEHNLDVIKTADHVIDIGPEGGDGGGEIVALGTPEQIAKVKGSWTGRYLKPMLERDAARRK
ncbi:MAG: excinuclease ABC subunit UvrA [Hellea sp.]